MAFPELVTREQWLEARKRLLVTEREETRRRDALNAERRGLPMVQISKEYLLERPQGKVGLAGLFGESRQLIVQHVMFDPAWDAVCPGCTAGIDELSDGVVAHLRSRDTAFALVSRAPLAKLQKYQAIRGWTAGPWHTTTATSPKPLSTSPPGASRATRSSPRSPRYTRRPPGLTGLIGGATQQVKVLLCPPPDRLP